MTETIGWGDVDERPRRLPALRLNRRRRVALVVVGALVAAGIVAWPSFRSWRADHAAAAIQHVWERAEGMDNTRIVTLSGVETTLSTLDRPAFAHLVVTVEHEEAAELDRLVRQAKSMRTWTSDVAAARRAVVAAMTVQAAALRTQAGRPAAIGIDLPLTTSVDGQSTSTANIAETAVGALRTRHHLKPFVPTTERFPSAAAELAALRRPTDQLLHLQLVTTGTDGVTVTDLDTGRVVVRRSLDTGNPQSWQPERLFGRSIVGNVEAGTLIVPLSAHGSEHVIANSFVQSSTGSPMWLTSYTDPEVSAVDGTGRTVVAPVALPNGLGLTGSGNGSILLLADAGSGSFDGPPGPMSFYLFHPTTGRNTKLAVTGCARSPALNGGLVVVPTGVSCDFPSELQVFDLTGRLRRTVPLPAGQTTTAAPLCAPDGRHVAVVTSVPSVEPEPTVVRLLDTGTGSWTTVRDSAGWLPASWSSDGKTLLLQQTDSVQFTGNRQFGQLAYLRVGDPTLHSIRLTPDVGDYFLG